MRRSAGPGCPARVLKIAAMVAATTIVATVGAEAREPSGELVVFVRSTGADSGSAVDLTRLEAVRDDGTAVTLIGAPWRMSPERFAGAGNELARATVPAGFYRQLRFVYPVEGEETTETVELEIPFRVRKKAATTLFATWRATVPFSSGSAMVVRLEQPQLRTLLIFVTNRGSGDVTVIQRHLMEVAGVIKVGSEPLGLDIDPTGRRVYVANAGSDSISVIETQSRQVLDVVELGFGARPADVAVSPDGRFFYVATADRASVLAFDALTLGQLEEATDVGVRPERIVVSPDGGTVYVASKASNSVTLLDARTLRLKQTLTVESQPIEMAVQPRVGRVFVGHAASNSVVVIGPDRRVENVFSYGSSINGLTLDNEGRRLYLAAGAVDRLLYGRSTSEAVTGFVALPAPGRLAVDPDGKSLYVLDPEGNRLRIINQLLAREEGTIPTGENPYDLVLLQ